jgi:hypothetical protein
MADYGEEGFLGVGFYHPSSLMESTEPSTIITTSARTNGIYFEENENENENENDRQQLSSFVAAKRCEEGTQHQQQQTTITTTNPPLSSMDAAAAAARIIVQQVLHVHPSPSSTSSSLIEKEAENSRIKAMDIIRKFNSQKEGCNPLSFIADNDCNISTSNTNNHAYNICEPPSNDTTPTSTEIQLSQEEEEEEEERQTQSSSSSIETDAQVARMKAMDIMRKFHHQQQQQQQQQSSVHTNNINCNDRNGNINDNISSSSSNSNYYGHPEVPIVENAETTTTTLVITTTPPWELKRRRRECLDRFEERIKRALFKNLEHVSLVEDERIRQKLDQVEQVKTLEQQIEGRYNQRLESRQQQRRTNNNNQNDINTSGAGIGTKQRNRAEKKRKRNALPSSLLSEEEKNKCRDIGGDSDCIINNNKGNSHSMSSSSSSVAIYVSNLPKDDGSTDGENIIKELFGSYGSIRKVHFYLDKISGRKKGDALVIYSLQEGEDEGFFLESVCSQVCTTILQHNKVDQ